MSVTERGFTEFAMRARAYAVKAHGDQRYGAAPYSVHLDAVARVLVRFGHTDEETVAAGFLHDAIEDAGVTHDELEREFGARVAALVDACTDGRGQNRKERKERPYRLIPKTPGSLLVKLADRIANVEAARADRPGLLEMYRKEHPEFERRLRGPAAAETMWGALGLLLGVR